ncbi:aminotransferase class III-fold pyridoxal phosphate-dependent enzyme [Acetoanaerobium sticklandii]|uniref:aminotransferase class III-fold pyridoxal phosphate-dependent enzyme n=1 Tax=Acetoanaerobium sticklandii TaxID=1511 RepID=UPI003A9449D3
MSVRYSKSEELLNKALKVIPLGTQTFSKSKTQYPVGAAPFYLDRGKGAKVWDVDGNEYTDFVNALMCVNLGYSIDEINDAVKEQIEKGVTFSLPAEIEVKLASRLVDIIPCAEMVRFAKNGTDCTSGAVRIARAYTGKDIILCCGYHGWQDWYIGTTSMNKGIPAKSKETTATFQYNNIESLIECFEKYEGNVAAVIMEPMNVAFPENDFLEKVKEVVHKNNALLIFDETITGFRFSKGGAQEYFNVTPDIATFGKGIANGYPLSAICGKREVMMEMENVFFSGTFGGETLSLVAADKVLDIIERDNVIETITELGNYLKAKLESMIEELSLQELVSVSGHPSWLFLNFKELGCYNVYEMKTYFLQEVFKRGFLTLGTHNLSFSHTTEDIDNLLNAYRSVLPELKSLCDKKSLLENIEGEILKPLFKVR